MLCCMFTGLHEHVCSVRSPSCCIFFCCVCIEKGHSYQLILGILCLSQCSGLSPNLKKKKRNGMCVKSLSYLLWGARWQCGRARSYLGGDDLFCGESAALFFFRVTALCLTAQGHIGELVNLNCPESINVSENISLSVLVLQLSGNCHKNEAIHSLFL